MRSGSSGGYFRVTFDVNEREEQTQIFASEEQLAKWCEEIEKFYKNYLTLPNDGDTLTNQTKQAAQQFLQHHLNELRRTVSPENIKRNRSLAEQDAEKMLNARQVIAPESAAWETVQKLGKVDAKSAFYALLLLAKIEPIFLPLSNGRSQFPRSLAGAVAVAAHLDFGEPSPKIDTSKFSAALSSAQTLFAQAREEISTFRSEIGEAKGKAADGIAKLHLGLAEAEAGLSALGQRVAKELEAVKAKGESLVGAFEAQVKTEAAFAYWTQKKVDHDKTAEKYLQTIKTFGKVVGAALVAALAVVYFMAGTTKAIEAPLWVPMLLGVLLLGTVWIGRVLSRLYLSQINLGEDAAERAVMIKTFVALVKEGGAKAENISIVLQSLFRPASKGPEGDDGSPPASPLELIVKRISGSS